MFSLTGNNSEVCLFLLTLKEIDSLQKCVDKVAKINNAVYKRLNENKNDFR